MTGILRRFHSTRTKARAETSILRTNHGKSQSRPKQSGGRPFSLRDKNKSPGYLWQGTKTREQSACLSLNRRARRHWEATAKNVLKTNPACRRPTHSYRRGSCHALASPQSCCAAPNTRSRRRNNSSRAAAAFSNSRFLAHSTMSFSRRLISRAKAFPSIAS